MITIKSKELKYYGNSRIVLNHRSYQICDLTVFGRTLVLKMQINAYLHPNILYLEHRKRYPRWNQSSQWLIFPNNSCVHYTAFFNRIFFTKNAILYRTKVAQKLLQKITITLTREIFCKKYFRKFFLAYSHFVQISFCESEIAQVLRDTLSRRYLEFSKIIKYVKFKKA